MAQQILGEHSMDSFGSNRPDLMQGDVILLVTEQQQTIVDKSKVQASVAKWKENGYSVVTTADLKLGSRAWAITGCARINHDFHSLPWTAARNLMKHWREH
jgi:hypothetical protein